PVEGWRAVVRQHLVGRDFPHGLGELLRFGKIGRRRLAPEQIGIRSVGHGARDRAIELTTETEKAFRRTTTAAKLAVACVDVTREQLRAVSVRASDEDGRYVEDVGGESSSDEGANELSCGNEDFSAEVAALLLRRKLVLEVDARSASLDHCLHQLEGVERSAEPGLCVRDHRCNPVARRAGDVAVRTVTRAMPEPLAALDLISAEECLIDPPHESGN